MDQYHNPAARPESADEQYIPSLPIRKGFWDRIFSTNWGLALICGLVAVGICVASLHSSHAESMAQEAPVAEVETSYSAHPGA